MPSALPRLFLARHGDTAWTDSRQRTGRTDLPLNEHGEERARQLGERLRDFSFTRVFTSPLQRALTSCTLAGFGTVAVLDPDLVEWDYLRERPGREMFRDGCPDGESPGDVATRADRFIGRVCDIEGSVLAFSSAHIIRMIAARWLGLPPSSGRFFFCRPASVGVLGFEHNSRDEPIIGMWNYVTHKRE
jgi:probable phosphoglycerate mutase